jgi:hypothetical protein
VLERTESLSDDQLLSPAEMADLRGVTKATLAAERSEGIGPPWVHENRRVSYPIGDFRQWCNR